MNKVLINLIVLIGNSVSIFCQNSHNINIERTIDSINELAWKNRKIYSTGKSYALEAKRLSDSIGYKEGGLQV